MFGSELIEEVMVAALLLIEVGCFSSECCGRVEAVKLSNNDDCNHVERFIRNLHIILFIFFKVVKKHLVF